MFKKIAAVAAVLVVIGCFAIPVDYINSSGHPQVVTYGETTYNNEDYKNIVNDYFNGKGYDTANIQEEIVSVYDVNTISKNITHRTYTDDQIFSCAMLDLSGNDSISVDVDDSKITVVSEQMYLNALNSSGITEGHVIVTSPTSATGESALAGILISYEAATGSQIPDEVKDAACNEIYSQSEVVNNSNASADDVADLVSEAKEEVASQNTTDEEAIAAIINNIASDNGMQISSNDTANLADSISQSQSVQSQASDYQEQISNYVNSEDNMTVFEHVWNFIQSIVNGSSSSNSSN